MLGIITPKVQENITAVGKVTLHVWTSKWGQWPAAAAEALKSGTVDARTEGKWAYPSPVLGSGGITPGKFVKI